MNIWSRKIDWLLGMLAGINIGFFIQNLLYGRYATLLINIVGAIAPLTTMLIRRDIDE